MASAAVIGDPLRICGYGLAGALLRPVADQPGAVRAWRELPPDVVVAVLTGEVAGWLAAELAGRPEVLPVVLPEVAASGGGGHGGGAPAEAVPG